MTTLILKGVAHQWVLVIASPTGQLLLWKEHLKLIDALNMASCLRLHVDNSAELPLQQYPLVEGGWPLLKRGA